MYTDLKITIPKEKRQDINNKILHIVNNNLEHPQINKNMIFNTYTGNGSLHGLNFNDFNNYHSFSAAKKEIENGQFFTPLKLSKFLALLLRPEQNSIIGDLTSGHGSLLNWLQVNDSNIYANELDINAYKVLKYLFPNINYNNDDIRNYEPNVYFDFIIGNPPYNIPLKVGKTTYNSQFFYLLKSYELLKPASIVAVIVPSAFLKDEFFNGGEIKTLQDKFNFIVSIDLPNNAFKSTGAEIQTKILVFQKKSEHIPTKENNMFTWVTVDDLNHKEALRLYNNFIKSLYEQKEVAKQKIILETNQANKEDQEFNFKVAKMLYHIKTGKNTKKHYNRAEEYLLRFRTEKQKDGEKFEEWQKRRITKNKVISYLTRILKDQHKRESDITKLVKNRYSLRLKAYNSKKKSELGKYKGVKNISFNEMILNNEYPFQDKTYKKLYNRKRKIFLSQSIPFNEMTNNSTIQKWLDDLVITDYTNQNEIRLNEIQKQDTNLLLQKPYVYLQWGTGSGKSISALAQMLYRQQYNKISNVFIIAPAIAIKNNWNEILEAYRIPFTHMTSLKDTAGIKHGQIVTMTFNMLVKYERFIKKHIKQQSQKVMLVLDEADGISNPNSKRYKSVLKCFRKVKYKLAMSATSTRNNIAESFPAFELLYNNSINLLSDNEKIFIEDAKTKELKEKDNDYYMKPIPAYKKGHTHFKRSYSPDKVTVFGVGKQSQNIYNSDNLKTLIDKTIITRSFEEVSGKNLYTIVQNTCKFNHAESELYRVIIEEFYKIVGMYRSTGNARKDALLRIIQQLNSMLKACVIPNTFDEFHGQNKPSKASSMLNMLKVWDNEIVAIGATHIKTVNLYANYIRSKFPNRPLFIVTGDSTSMKQRREIIEQLKQSKNGILLCTQQSLSSSMNIDFVNKVLLIELQWNFAAMHQFFARFIRYTSTEQKEIHFLTIQNSIESNLLQLIMNKEKLNLFMKNDEVDNTELFERFGIDFDILSMLLTKEIDSEGKSYIEWGKQTIM